MVFVSFCQHNHLPLPRSSLFEQGMEAMNTNTSNILDLTSEPTSDIHGSIAKRSLTFVKDGLSKLTSNFDGNPTTSLDHEKIRRDWAAVAAGFSQLKQAVSNLDCADSISLIPLTTALENSRDLAKTALPLKKNINASTPVKDSYQITHYLDIMAKESKSLELYSTDNAIQTFQNDLSTLKDKILESPDDLLKEWTNVNSSHLKLVEELEGLHYSQLPSVDLSRTYSDINSIIDLSAEKNPQVFKLPSKTNEFTLPYMLAKALNKTEEASGQELTDLSNITLEEPDKAIKGPSM